jgi:hypothetical protein
MADEVLVCVVQVWAEASTFFPCAREADAVNASEFVDPRLLLLLCGGSDAQDPPVAPQPPRHAAA